MGLTIEEAITIFLKQVIKTKTIPLNLENECNKETKEAIKEAKEMIKNPNKYKSFNSVEELMEDLNN